LGRVEGKVVVITGAARGQGRSHAVRLSGEGADIIAIDICSPLSTVKYRPSTPNDLAETAKMIERQGRRVVTKQVDVRDADQLQAAVDDGVSQLGRLDVVVANAGIAGYGTWDKITQKMWDEMIGVNLTGVWNTMRVCIPHLIAAGGGSMILTSSTGGIKGIPFLTHYVAAKHGVVGLMRGFASELSEHNIRVNTLHPAGVKTEMVSPDGHGAMDTALAAHPRLAPMFVNMLPIERVELIDVSNAVLYLASDESRFVTSTEFMVDAGHTQF
jgi:SDR family mycofactocin-dependent oxidoreductase